jgi:hypothetical protein
MGRKIMSLHELLTIADIESLFKEEITALGGTVEDTFADATRLFARSILPARAEVRPADQVQGGVALRASEQGIWVHPYVFRQVCRNGAIMAHAIETRRLELPAFATPEEATTSVREAIRACGSPEAFTTAAQEMRSAVHTPADMALTMLPFLSRLSARQRAGILPAIMERFFADTDRSQFALMNAVTSLARDTPDPEMRWRLEELGGGIPAGRPPEYQPDDSAMEAALVG